MEPIKLPEEMALWNEAFFAKVAELESRVSRYMTKAETAKVREACIFGAWAHQGQSRSSGEPYIFHPIEVALILTLVQLDIHSIVGAVLHDVIEDTEITFDEIKDKFGKETAEIVDGVSKLTKIRFSSKLEAKAENFRKMILAMTKDLRVIMVKLADRLHNMRTLGALAPYKKRRIARDTLDIYTPIAARLGMFALQVELENLCFENIYPMRYRILQEFVNKKRISQGPTVQAIREAIQEKLNIVGISARISIREKHGWSLYKKLQKRGSTSQLSDIFSIRVIVNSTDECYRVLGIVHSLNKPIIGRFKDFIAIPKVNGYQSLHTVVFGANMLPVEVQIRTKEMHIIAEAGAAAHWRYGEAYREQNYTKHKTREWLDYVTELQNSMLSSEEFMASMKEDLFPSEIYVFTPNGRIIELPKGSTAVDFAYAIHSDIGNHCISAKVDAKFAPISQVLVTGQTVEIQTSQSAQPNPMWLEFVRTAKARSAIRSYLSKLSYDDTVVIGRNLLENAMKQKNIALEQLTDEVLARLAKELQVESVEAMYAGIGSGKRPSSFIINRLEAHGLDVEQEFKHSHYTEQNSGTVDGANGREILFGDCCYPIPGDSIMGYWQPRHGKLVVHRTDCHIAVEALKHLERCYSLTWNHNKEKALFPVQLCFIIKNQRGVIAEITKALVEMDVNINDLRSQSINGDFSHIWMVIHVPDRIFLANVFRHLKKLDNVVRIGRQNDEA